MSVGFVSSPDATSPGDLVSGIIVGPAFRVAYPYTVSVWFKGPYVETRRNDCLVNLAGRASGNSIRLDCHAGQLRHRVNGQSVLTTTYVKNNAWTHALAVGASSTDRRIYANGGGMGQSVVDVTPTAGDSATLGAQMSPGLSPGWVSDSMFLGQLAELAVWSSELTEAEILELGHGANPLDFQLASLVYYHHLFNDFDVVYGAEINQSGIEYYQPIQVYAAPQDHPPIAYAPASVRSVFMPDRGVPPMPPPIDSAPGSMSGRRRPSAPSGLIQRQPPSGLCRGGGGLIDLTTRAELGGVLPMPGGEMTADMIISGELGGVAPMPVGALTADMILPPSWTERESNRNWIAIASSSDGSKLIAAVYSGQLYTSTDYGATWTARESSRGWYSVASSADGDKLVACVYSGQIYTSTDYGVSWAARESSRAWIAVASSDDGTELVALADGGNIYTSTDSGASWTDRGMGGESWNGAASSSDGVKLAVASYSDHIYTSINSGVNWTERSNFGGTGGPRSIASSSDGTRLLAGVGGGSVNYLYTSSDSGANWTQRESTRHWMGVASSTDGAKLAAIDHSGKVYVSADYGVSWTAENENRLWRAIASNADGTKLAAVVAGGKIYTKG